MDSFTFLTSEKSVSVPLDRLLSHSSFFRKLLEDDPTCRVLEFRNASYEALQAAVHILAFQDDTFFWGIIMRSRKVRKGAAPDQGEERESVKRQVISLFEVCQYVELHWYGALCAKELSQLLQTPRELLKGLRLAVNYQATDPTEGAGHLKYECLSRLPKRWPSGSEETAWRDLCVQCPSLLTEWEAFCANAVPSRKTAGAREERDVLPSYSLRGEAYQHSVPRAAEDTRPSELDRRIPQLEQELQALERDQEKRVTEAYQRQVSQLQEISDSVKKELSELRRELDAMDAQKTEEETLYATYNDEANYLDEYLLKSNAYLLAMQATEEELSQLILKSSTLEGLKRQLAVLMRENEEECISLERRVTSEIQTKRNIIGEIEKVSQRLAALQDHT